MTRAILFLTKIIIVVFIAMLFSACRYHVNLNDDAIEGNGNIQTETRTINEDFHGVYVESSIEVIIEQSNDKSVVVEADDNLLSNITTRVDNGVLHIETEGYSTINGKRPKVTVKMPLITELSSSASSSIRSTNTIITDNLVVKSESDSEIEINVEADTISLEAESTGSIKASGKALKLKVASESASEVDAKMLMANEVMAVAESAGRISVYPIVSLNANASSAGSITYHKTPKNISKESDSAGSISED